MAALEATLSQEQAMHNVTKVQLSSVKEDNQRLRQQLQTARRRSTTAVELASYVYEFENDSICHSPLLKFLKMVFDAFNPASLCKI
jgi:hypothetical protein